MHLYHSLGIIALVVVVVIWIFYSVLQASYTYKVCGIRCVQEIVAYLGIIYVVLIIPCIYYNFGYGVLTLTILLVLIFIKHGLYLWFTRGSERCDTLRDHSEKEGDV